MMTPVPVHLDELRDRQGLLYRLSEPVGQIGPKPAASPSRLRCPAVHVGAPLTADMRGTYRLAHLAGAEYRQRARHFAGPPPGLGTPTESIIESVCSFGVDLVVVGTHGTAEADAATHPLGAAVQHSSGRRRIAVYLAPFHRRGWS